MFSFREVIQAIRSYGLAHRFLLRDRSWKWVFLPGLVFTILFFPGVYSIWHFSEYVNFSLAYNLGLVRWIQDLENGWVSFLFILLGLSLRLVILSFCFSLLRYLLVLLGSRWLDQFSAMTESTVISRGLMAALPPPDPGRSGRMAVRNLLVQTVSLAVLLVLSFIPLLGLITPLVCLILEGYFLGFSLLEHGCRLKGLSYEETIRFCQDHRGLAIGNGLMFYLLLFIPVAGWILAPSYAIIAGTISLHKKI